MIVEIDSYDVHHDKVIGTREGRLVAQSRSVGDVLVELEEKCAHLLARIEELELKERNEALDTPCGKR